MNTSAHASRRLRRAWAAAIVLTGADLGACTSWRPSIGPLEDVVVARPAPAVRLSRGDGMRLVMSDPEIRGDSVVGNWEVLGRTCAPPPPGAVNARVECSAQRGPTSRIAIADVELVEVRRSDGLKTVALLALVAAVIRYPLYYLYACGWDGRGCS